MHFQVSDTGIVGKKIIRILFKKSRTNDLPITSSDALALSFRGIVGAKDVKLGSCDKRPEYCRIHLISYYIIN